MATDKLINHSQGEDIKTALNTIATNIQTVGAVSLETLGMGFTTCSTEQATAAKTATLTGYTIADGGIVSVKFSNAVDAGATLNINSQGAKPIYYKGVAITNSIINAGAIATFVYSNNQYQLINLDTDVEQVQTNKNNILSLHNIDTQIRNEIDNNIYYKDMYGYTTGYYYFTNGNKTANPDWGYTDLIPVDSSTVYELVTSSGSTLFICYYDSNKQFISGATSSSSITTPATAAYVRLSVPIIRIDSLRFAKGKYKNNVSMIITCGENQQYTRLRDAVKAGVNYGATVIVYPGTYDLTQEFATELSTTLIRNTGIMLSNGVDVKFMSGAFVTANFDGSSESISEYFSPFIADNNSSGFTLENAHIVASNCRYCVHDEHKSQGTYTNRYINCHMEMTTTRETKFFQQAIGGGLGEHGTIIIEGGYYKSNPSYGAATYGEYGTAQNIQQPITYHNGSRQCYGHITISNVYLADRSYLRFGSYGISTEKTPVEVSNCSFGLPILDMYETEQSTNRNFGITAYNNVSRNAEVPFDFSRVIDIYTNSDDT